MLEQAYNQCLRRLDNPLGQHPYNLVVTKEWMLMVNRSKSHCGQIQVNSMGYLGMLFAGNSDQLKEINDKSPVEILNQLAVPVGAYRKL